MTIKGETVNETIEATIKNNTNTFTLDFAHTINRTKYGVNFNSPSIFTSSKENLISDDFMLQGRFVFNK